MICQTGNTLVVHHSSHSLPPLRIRGRSFLALVLSPKAPLVNWLQSLDEQIKRSSQFFYGKPVILNLELLTGDEEGLEKLYHELLGRNIQIISMEGLPSNPSALKDWPKNFILTGGKNIDNLNPPIDSPAKNQSVPCYITDDPVRSGQSIFFPEGDIIVVNSVASGAEISAGGSIHVYGALRGRAIAGISGQPNARIFTSHMAAELLAIDGYYMTAEEIPEAFNNKSAQVFLKENIITVTNLTKTR